MLSADTPCPGFLNNNWGFPWNYEKFSVCCRLCRDIKLFNNKGCKCVFLFNMMILWAYFQLYETKLSFTVTELEKHKYETFMTIFHKKVNSQLEESHRNSLVSFGCFMLYETWVGNLKDSKMEGLFPLSITGSCWEKSSLSHQRCYSFFFFSFLERLIYLVEWQSYKKRVT